MKIIVLFLAGTLLFSGCDTTLQKDLLDPGSIIVTPQTPLNDPERFSYNGYDSGLYPWGNELGSNDYAEFYQNACMDLMPLDSAGNETYNGKIVILALGGSNPAIIFNGLINSQLNDTGFGSQIVFINAAQNAAYFSSLINPGTEYWDLVDFKLDSAGVTAEQVSVIFCIEDDQTNRDTTFERAFEIRNSYIELLDLLRTKYPQNKLFYAGDRGYGGYTTSVHNQEPRGYLNGWAVKFLVQDYIDGNLPEYPVVNWLDYYWADGAVPRWDGLTYLMSDFRGQELLHLTDEKGNELGSRTHERLKTDAGAQYWYN